MTSTTTTSVLEAETTRPQGSWVGRPRLARLVRLAVVGLPIVLATLVGWLVARALPPAHTDGVVMVQRLLILAVAGAVAWASGPLAKRLMPLGAMLELTLVFPDKAPPRMATAMQSKSTQSLAELIARTKRDGLPEDSSEAARTVLSLVGALSRHDHITRGHSERVRAYAALIGKEMGLSQERIDRLGWAGLLHDVGKLTIDAEILNKPTSLTDDEYAIIKTHAEAGARMVEPLRGWLGDALDAVGQHHERWDGTGYPNRLRGNEISLEARIMSVADVFDVITAARSYKSPSSPAEARQEIARHAGTQFDPEVVRAFLAISMSDFRIARGPMALLVQLPFVASVTAAGALPAVGSAAAATVVLGASASMPAMSVYDYLGQAAPVAATSEEPAELVAASATPTTPPADRSSSASRATVASGAAATSPDGGDSGPAAGTANEDEGTEPRSPGAPPASAGAQPAAEPATSGSGNDDRQAEFERAVAEARAEAAAKHRKVDERLDGKLADIAAKDAEKVQKAQDKYAAATAEADAQRAEDEADLAEDRAERNEKIAEINRDLDEELAELRADRDEDLAKVERDRQRGKLSDEEAAAKRQEIEGEYQHDVAEAQAEAQEDRDDANAKVAEAERKAREDYEEATREAVAERDAALAKNQADRDAERAQARQEAAEDHTKIDSDLARRLRELEDEYDMPPDSA